MVKQTVFYIILLVLGIHFNGFCQEKHMMENNSLLDTLIIKSHSLKSKKKQATTVISTDFKQSMVASNLAELLSYSSGVNIRKVGGNNSKPIIDGLSSSRLIYLPYGVRLENQDWADQHAPEINTQFTDFVAIIRNAQTVRYGSNALGGVINLDNLPLPDSINQKVQVSTTYSSNTKGINQYLKYESRINKIPELSFNLQMLGDKKGDYHTAKYNVGNTGSRNLDSHLSLNYNSIPFKSRIVFNTFNQKQGNFFGALSGNTEELEEIISLGRPLNTTPFTYKIDNPYQQTTHYFLLSDTQWKVSNLFNVKFKYSFQNNIKKEYEVRRMDRSKIPSQSTNLTAHYLETTLETSLNNFTIETGVSTRRKNNENQQGTGVAPTIPNYDFLTNSFFFLLDYKYSFGNIDLGARFDKNFTDAQGIDFLGNTYGDKKSYQSWSYQLANEIQLKKWTFSSSLTYGWRPPEVYELFVNGKQHGLPIYYVGDKNLREERALKWFNSIGFYGDKIHFQLNAFIHHFDNYIFSYPTGQYKQLFSGPAILFQFQQVNASIKGIDLQLDMRISNKLNLSSKWSVLQGKTDKGDYLPNISPLKVINILTFKAPFKFIDSINLEHLFFAKKKHFTMAYELSKSTPSQTSIFNVVVDKEFSIHKNKFKVIIRADNILNKQYKEYLDLHRYFVHSKGRDLKLSLIFNI